MAPSIRLDHSETNELPTGETLYRVVATDDIDTHDVAKGDRGGWASGMHHFIGDNVWVGDHATVRGHALLADSAAVGGAADISGRAFLYGNAYAGDCAKMSGAASAGGFALLSDNAALEDGASITGHAVLRDNAIVGGTAHMSGFSVVGDAATVTAGRVGGRACVLGGAVVDTPAVLVGDAAIDCPYGYIFIGPVGDNRATVTGADTLDGGQVTIVDNGKTTTLSVDDAREFAAAVDDKEKSEDAAAPSLADAVELVATWDAFR